MPGWAAAFAAFLVAGHPAHRTAPRVLAAVLVGVDVLSGAITLTLSTPSLGVGVVGLPGHATLGLGIAFGISAMLVAARPAPAAIASRSRRGVVPVIVGALVLAFGRSPKS